MVRTLVVGLVVALGRELGLAWCELHGTQPGEVGHTELPELAWLHRYTARRACSRALAFLASPGEVQVLVRSRWSEIRDRAVTSLAGSSLPAPRRRGRQKADRRADMVSSQAPQSSEDTGREVVVAAGVETGA